MKQSDSPTIVNRRAAITALASFWTLATVASATPFAVGNDVNPRVSNGRIVTDAIDHDTLELVSDVRHFSYSLGGVPNNPYFTSDPGFNALAGSGLPTGQQLRFDLHRRLVRWDGSGVVRFQDISSGETLRFQFGAASATATGSSGFVPGFSVGNVGSGGSIHRHLNAFLEGATPPAPGLYFTVMRIFLSGGSVANSDGLYMAYNNGLINADFMRGMAYLADPIPGDTNFDAAVNFADLLTLAQNYGALTDASWFDGDFNRDRQVNFNDLLALAQQYGTASLADGSNFEADWALAQSMVPEPITASLIPLAGVVLRRRRQHATTEETRFLA